MKKKFFGVLPPETRDYDFQALIVEMTEIAEFRNSKVYVSEDSREIYKGHDFKGVFETSQEAAEFLASLLERETEDLMEKMDRKLADLKAWQNTLRKGHYPIKR